VKGYNVFSHGLDDNNERGVVIYVASDFLVSMVDIPVNFQEALFVILRGKGVTGQLLFGTIYRSPSSNEMNAVSYTICCFMYKIILTC